MNLDAISSLEIVDHVGSGFFITMVKDVVFRVHLPLNLMDLVGSVRTVLGHDDGTLELTVDKVGIVSHASIGDQSEAMIN
jgi:hypothetical protein|tara:strand:+ start:2048 stop:2287 length:240 start_codon:yes stop_codon:yes gene_type:complete